MAGCVGIMYGSLSTDAERQAAWRELCTLCAED